jgi:hypothetical protein
MLIDMILCCPMVESRDSATVEYRNNDDLEKGQKDFIIIGFTHSFIVWRSGEDSESGGGGGIGE